MHRAPGRSRGDDRALPRRALLPGIDDDGDVDATQGAQVAAGTTLDVSEGRWLLNPGSVGQPRDGDPRAAWLELDTEAWSATYRRIEYPLEDAAESIISAGLPEHLGRRLFVGQ